MAHFEVEGQKIEVADDWTVGELIRAENALDIDMETAKMAGKTALVLYISLARAEQWKPGSPGNRGLADMVMRMELSVIGEQVADEAPLEEDSPGNVFGIVPAAESDEQRSSGLPPSEASA